ncbi:MAG: 2-hydroxyacyl-CoA dehydratase [Candidatus Helarchaeota archaeon]|nr:2-hydroxyacyl-CoA dehydratase [Candidatus Helarchaeota archaeon]
MTREQMFSEVVQQLKKYKEANKKIYGILAHGLVPEEIIHAASGFPLRLSLVGDKDSASKGIEYLTSATCSFARSTIGHFDLKNALYDEIETIIAGNYCNGELCATEMISEYFNIPRINIVFPSAKTDSALRFLIAELNHFKEDIERFSGIKLSEDKIAEAIKLYNNERKLMQEVVNVQRNKNYVLSGVECLELMHHHFLYGVEASIGNLQTTVIDLSEKTSPIEGKKIIFAGNGVPIGDNIIQLSEAQGLSVIKNLTWTGLDYYDSLVDQNKPPLEALADYYLNLENSGRMILSDDYFTNLAEIYKNSHADGIIFYKVKYCSIVPSVISSKLKEILSEQNIPYVEIEREYGVNKNAQLQTRLQAFQEMIA